MSIADWEIDEEEVRWCEEHHAPRPCRQCRIEAAEDRAEEIRNEGYVSVRQWFP